MQGKLSKKLSALFIAIMLLFAETPVVNAHSGRTDAYGGHHDYNNKSGLGYYHYHCGGHPAHLHKNGVCPYRKKVTKTSYKKTTYKTTKNKVIVKVAQQKLNDLGYNCGKADGIMGKNTKAALKRFQKAKGLKVDGILGPQSQKALGI